MVGLVGIVVCCESDNLEQDEGGSQQYQPLQTTMVMMMKLAQLF